MRLSHIVVLAALTSVAPFSPALAASRFSLFALRAPQQTNEADGIYRRARRALDQKNYDDANKLFESILTRFPKSTYAPDALYWKAFALYRLGSLQAAQAALETQAQRYPDAPTREDAGPLLITIKGELAKRGATNARRDVDNVASAAASTATSAPSATSASAATTASGACEDMDMRIAALDALMQMDADRAMPILKKVLQRRDECSTKLRQSAVF